ncbi:MAG: hypothetical protein GQ570_14185 [Helicobacteraceae bacterium]|nr:hypothetical protein [Helicobacteraceae bacterium]
MKKIVLIPFLFMALNATELLTSDKEQILLMEAEKAVYDYENSRDSWINPLTLSTSITKSKDSLYQIEGRSQDSSIKFSQDVFRSGGILEVIDSARESKKSTMYLISSKRASYLKSLYVAKLTHDRNSLQMQQSTLYIDNYSIAIDINKDRFEVGEVDISVLNISLVDKDREQTKYLTFQNGVENTVLDILSISDIKVENIVLPQVELLSEEEYLRSQLDLLSLTSQSNALSYTSQATTSAYLPKVTLAASYGYKDFDSNSAKYDNDNYSYGATLSIPLDYKMISTIQSAKLNSLKSKKEVSDTSRTLKITYKKHINNIHSFKAKSKIAKSNIKLYEELVDFTKEQYDAGYKTKLDYDSLKNSLEIQKLEERIQAYNIEIEKFSIYFETLNAVK